VFISFGGLERMAKLSSLKHLAITDYVEHDNVRTMDGTSLCNALRFCLDRPEYRELLEHSQKCKTDLCPTVQDWDEVEDDDENPGECHILLSGKKIKSVAF
jgi:hypothetical protein